MMRNRILTAAALLFGLALAGCDSFDPLDKFQDWDIMGTSKTPLKGERRPVFDHGVPGVPQGVPPELVKGYQQPAEEPPPVIQAKPAKPKAASKARPPAATASGAGRTAAAAAGPAGTRGADDHTDCPRQRRRLADHAGRTADMADERAAGAATLKSIGKP